MTNNVPDYYFILGVEPKASLDEIREAYKKQALLSHPDRLPPTATPQEREEATRKFQLIADAYFILGDRTRRESYDKSRSKNKTGFTPFSSAKPNASPNQANQMFGSVFEELLKVEVERPGHLWKLLGSGAGFVIGFILANVPGALAGAVAGKTLGGIRDNKGTSVYSAFQKLSYDQKRDVLTGLLAKFVTGGPAGMMK